MINKNKILSLCMAAIIAASAMPTSALAASVGSNSADKGVGLDTVQNAQTVYTDVIESDSQSQVYLTVDDSPIVASLPTSIILSGEANSAGEYIGNYSISAQGEVSGDKVVNIAPDKNNVELIQKGKNNKNANIEQQSTAFDSALLKDIAKTTGVITADKLTAGSWNSSFNFNISVDKINSFYSSLDLAVADINAETVRTKNTQADLYTSENAVCGVYKNVDGSYRIELYKDLDNQKAVSISKNVEIDLNNHTINFAIGCGFVLNADSAFCDGVINTVNYSSIQSNNATSSFVSKNITINAMSTNDYNNVLGCIINNALNNTLLNTNLNSINKANNKYSIGYYGKNKNSITNIDNCKIDVKSNNSVAIGIQVSKCNINNIDITSYSTSGAKSEVKGIYSASGESHILKNVTITAKVEYNPSVNNIYSTTGIAAKSGTFDIYNCNIKIDGYTKQYASTGIEIKENAIVNMHSGTIKVNDSMMSDVDCANSGIHVYGNLNIDESNGKVFIKGGNNAISVNGINSNVNINGGTYCSPNHGGLYNVRGKSIIIKNAVLYNSKTSGEDKDAVCEAYGGMYSSGPGTITISNSRILGGSHGIRVKNESGAANITINNSYIEGQNDVLSLTAGTFTVGENVVIKSKTGKLIEDNPQGTLVDPNGTFSK